MVILLKRNTTYKIEQKLNWLSILIVTDADQRHIFTDFVKMYQRDLKIIKLSSSFTSDENAQFYL